ncbi:MAG: anti-sigma factor family protein [Sediminispirochaetaceae bacterium]
MCYDKITLSAFSDGELEIGKRREIEAHLRTCRRCSSIVIEYQRLHEILSVPEADRSEEYTIREHNSWNRLQTRIRREKLGTGVPFWRRRILVPLPLAAGVLFAVGILIAALIITPGVLLPDDTATVIAQQVHPGVEAGYNGGDPSLAELEKLVQFLSAQGAAIEVKIELPSTSHFEVIGEPQLIKAADYRKGSAQ